MIESSKTKNPEESIRWEIVDEDDKNAVKEQLERILAADEFRLSKRSANFLRYGVTHSLEHKAESLKERIVGMEVFGRPVTYDTNTDPIVRVAATEVRKRIAQYYSKPGHEDELRIVLPPGGYVPQFFRANLSPEFTAPPDPEPELRSDSAVPPDPEDESPISIASLPHDRKSRHWWVSGIVVAACVLVMLFVWRRETSQTPLESFWAPVFSAAGPVDICIADQSRQTVIALQDAQDPLHQTMQAIPVSGLSYMAIDNTVPLLAVANLMQGHRKEYHVQAQSSVSFADLRRGPNILIGAFSNGWTLRLTEQLRFHFANDPGMNELWIEDRQHPDLRTWIRNAKQIDSAEPFTDYAIVARFQDPVTNENVIVAAGLGNGGTAAAGEFLVDSQAIREAVGQAPHTWDQKGMEVVLASTVIGSHSGPPRILQTYFW